MALATGDRLGPYQILAPIGSGGMGEVYRARDTKLKREVALKVLPEAFARDPERMARFQREAEVLASLNHPNIAQIYGVEERAIVMELVEGESPKGQMPFEEAWKIASQMAAGLEYAHEKGIVHRDLKPANLKVTPEGVVKLLDFGLAKAFTGPTTASGNLENSPTLTLGVTQVGVILGTAAYMSPEQAQGKMVDKRTDIWSFGAVLYELLTGERLFRGNNASDTLAQVLTKPPNLDNVPWQARRLLRECLEKDPKDRLRDIGDAKRLLVEEAVPLSESRLGARFGIAVSVIAVLAMASAAVLAFVHFREERPQPHSVRFQILPPGRLSADTFRISPDGRFVVMAASGRLWVRALDSLEAKALAGTEGASFPFWAPNSASLGFFAQGKLKRVSVAGGPPQTLCDVSSARGGTWNQDDVIVFSPSTSGGLYRIPAAGGVPVPLTKTTGNHRFPEFLPGGRIFLFLARQAQTEAQGISIGSLDGSVPVQLLPDDSSAVYFPGVARGSGYILFLRQNTLMAQPFNPARLQVVGEMFPVAEQVDYIPGTGFGQFSVSGNGALVYGNSGGRIRDLTWVDRAGHQIGPAVPAGDFADFRLSPDEKRIVFSRVVSGNQDLWVRDLQRGITSRLTFDIAQNNLPIWSPDGLRIVWSSNRSGMYNLYLKSATGSGAEDVLIKTATATAWATDWSRDGRFILYEVPGAKRTGEDLWIAPQFGDRKPFPYLQGPFDEQQGVFSPDGRWIAYVSNESGHDEVYVQAFPLSSGKWQISNGGGTGPAWRKDGTELFYLAADRNLMAAPIKPGNTTLEPGSPQPLFPVPLIPAVVLRDEYAPAADGRRFLVNRLGGEAAAINVVLNWTVGLKK